MRTGRRFKFCLWRRHNAESIGEEKSMIRDRNRVDAASLAVVLVCRKLNILELWQVRIWVEHCNKTQENVPQKQLRRDLRHHHRPRARQEGRGFVRPPRTPSGSKWS